MDHKDVESAPGSENSGKIMKFPQGSVILQEGEQNLDMYKIVQGHAELYTGYGTDREVLLGIIGPQSVFGEFGLLSQKPSIYTVIAFSDVYALRITEGNMGDFVRENHRNIIEIMRNMSNTMLIMQHQITLLAEVCKKTKDLLKEVDKINMRGYLTGGKTMHNSKMHYLDSKLRERR